jgi:hypothetical protein
MQRDLGGERDFDAVVRHGGTTVERKGEGDVVVKTNGNATVYTNPDVKVRTLTAGAARLSVVADGRIRGRRLKLYVGPRHAAYQDQRTVTPVENQPSIGRLSTQLEPCGV